MLCADWIDEEVLPEVQLVLNLRMKCTGDFLKDSYAERNMRFGIREFGMGAVCNALSLDKTGTNVVNPGMSRSQFVQWWHCNTRCC